MLGNITAFNGFAALVLAVHLGVQQPDHPLARLRKLGLSEAPGSVPVLYVRSEEQRAIRLQKSLEAANSWFENQLHVQAPMTPSYFQTASPANRPLGLIAIMPPVRFYRASTPSSMKPVTFVPIR